MFLFIFIHKWFISFHLLRWLPDTNGLLLVCQVVCRTWLPIEGSNCAGSGRVEEVLEAAGWSKVLVVTVVLSHLEQLQSGLDNLWLMVSSTLISQIIQCSCFWTFIITIPNLQLMYYSNFTLGKTEINKKPLFAIFLFEGLLLRLRLIREWTIGLCSLG